jgi:CheY-like chemotaxis protein
MSDAKTIVVVDDEPEMVLFLRSVLQDNGYRVLSAPNGRIGIEKIVEEKPDLVFLDVLMPVVQGTDALRYLRSRPELDKTKIVLMSSLTPKEFDHTAADRNTADEYLLKPVSTRHILETVGKLLSHA